MNSILQRQANRKQLLISATILIIGLADGLFFSFDLAYSYIYKDDYGLSPAKATYIDNIKLTPWMIKPLWGIISDNIIFCGYRRKSYILLFSSIGMLTFFMMGSLEIPLTFMLITMLFNNIAASFDNCMGEALVVQNTIAKNKDQTLTDEEKQKNASKEVALFWSVRYVGKVIGYLAFYELFVEDQRKHYMLNGIIIQLVVFIFGVILPESRRIKQKSQKQTETSQFIKRTNQKDLGREQQQQQEIQMQDLQKEEGGFSGTKPQNEGENSGNSDTEMLSNTESQYSDQREFSKANLQKAKEFLKNPTVYKCIIFIFCTGFVPSSSQTKFFYYTKVLQFDGSFIALLRVCSYVAILLGILVYNRFFRNTTLKKFFQGICLICFAINLTFLIVIYRWNLSFGISDKVFCMIDTFLIEITFELRIFPILIYAARICPKNLEGTVFSIIVAFNNIGIIASSSVGGVITDLLGISSENFDNMDKLTMVTSIAYMLPLTVLYFINFDSLVEQTENENADGQNKFRKLNYSQEFELDKIDDRSI